ncbi:unnamed protein product, partial [Adineta steineri]
KIYDFTEGEWNEEKEELINIDVNQTSVYF